VTGVALIPSGDSYFQRLFGFQLRKCMRWGQPLRRTALGLGAEVKITSVRNGSALPAEVDATSASFADCKLHSVGATNVTSLSISRIVLAVIFSGESRASGGLLIRSRPLKLVTFDVGNLRKLPHEQHLAS
jgi:hypothetical protein